MQPQVHWPVLSPPFPSSGMDLPWQEAGKGLIEGVLTARPHAHSDLPCGRHCAPPGWVS